MEVGDILLETPTKENSYYEGGYCIYYKLGPNNYRYLANLIHKSTFCQLTNKILYDFNPNIVSDAWWTRKVFKVKK